MDDQQARAWIAEAGKYGIVYGLDSIRALMVRLQNVQEQIPVIHVAGTNGKGSVCTMLASILQEAGYRTGLYSSPAVFEPEEIIKVCGKNISREAYAAIATKIQDACEDMVRQGLPHPTSFEIETALAFCYFKEENCEIAVIEAGMGGKLDATNLIKHPVCSVLTSVGRDHMAYLGQTLTQIAQAKAGIMKCGCPCVTVYQKPEVMEVFEKAALACGSMLYIARDAIIQAFSYDGQGSRFTLNVWEGVDGFLPLAGTFQKQNLACVLSVVTLLRENGYDISRQALLAGLSNAYLPGRFERIGKAPEFYIDGAHNEAAALRLRETVQAYLAGRRIVYIIGVFADKEYEKLLRVMLPYAAQVFTVTPDHPRALDGRKLVDEVEKFHKKATYVPDISQAAMLASDAAGRDGAVLAFGSFSYLGALRRAEKDRQQEGYA